jgi:lysophospholipase L1-like esterase
MAQERLNWDEMLIARNSKVVMAGDSITDCGRARPVGEGLNGALGNGYVALIDALFGACHPQHAMRIVNMGVGGNTVRDLRARWQADVMDQRPNWVTILIGINDVWRQFDVPRMREAHVLPDEYERTLRDIVERTLPVVQGMVLMTPFYVEPRRTDPMRIRMDQYGEVVRRVAMERRAVFVDTQAAFDELLPHYYPSALASDRVHPTLTGHMAIARAFMAAIGFT